MKIPLSKKARKDILMILALTVATYVACGAVDIFEFMIAFCEEYEDYEMDEVVCTSAFLGLYLLVFSFRRFNESNTARKRLFEKNEELREAMSQIRELKGIVPICSSCKKIRDDKGYWNLLEAYIEKHSKAQFSHGICPDCAEDLYGNDDWFQAMKNESGKNKSDGC